MIACGRLVPMLMLLGVVVVAIMNMSIDGPRDRGLGLAYRSTTLGGGWQVTAAQRQAKGQVQG